MTIHLQNLSKSYGSRTALDGISLTLPAGSITAIMGRNGAGKSTLLRAIATVSPPDQGHIFLDDRPLTREALDLRRQMMFLPDFPVLFAEETVLKNLSLLLRLYECDTPGREQDLTGLLTEFDMLGCAAAQVSTLSRGQAYKAALIAMIAIHPRLWLLDEPFASGMDPVGLTALKTRLRAAAAEGCTILFSTQIPEIAEPLASHYCILENGRIAASGPMSELHARSGSLDAVFASLHAGYRPEK